jgi:dolichol-phosphate mannosyltransferase
VLSPSLTVILPTLNEAGNIGHLIKQIRETVPTARIIVVDDSSSDGTPDIVRNLISKNGLEPFLSLIERQGVPCLTKAIQAGIDASNTDFVGWMDADMSHPPSVLPKLLAGAEITGCGVASRFLEGSVNKQTSGSPDSFAAKILSIVLNYVVRQWLQIKVTDFTSGFIICKSNLLHSHRLVGDYGEYFIELMHYFAGRNIKVYEVAFSSPPRNWGESKTGTTFFQLARRGVKYLALAVRLRFTHASVTSKKKDHSLNTDLGTAIETLNRKDTGEQRF